MFYPNHVSSEVKTVKRRVCAQAQAVAISANSASLKAGLVSYSLLGIAVLLLYAAV